ncbi:hypothetical protein GCM10023259_009770 [Thermocatellispora tengchongensis]
MAGEVAIDQRPFREVKTLAETDTPDHYPQRFTPLTAKTSRPVSPLRPSTCPLRRIRPSVSGDREAGPMRTSRQARRLALSRPPLRAHRFGRCAAAPAASR